VSDNRRNTCSFESKLSGRDICKFDNQVELMPQNQQEVHQMEDVWKPKGKRYFEILQK